jgi:hypothetical protein
MTLTNKILDLLVGSKWLNNVVVGPYSSEKEIQSKVYYYNKTRGVDVRMTQKRLLLVNPETLETERVWRVELVSGGKGVKV